MALGYFAGSLVAQVFRMDGVSAELAPWRLAVFDWLTLTALPFNGDLVQKNSSKGEL
jgi:hypothetical protein